MSGGLQFGWGDPEDDRRIDDYKAQLEAMKLEELLIECGCEPRTTAPGESS